jgi:8-oxo-dGTP pyrophosphatase MutT (NUDIX family)
MVREISAGGVVVRRTEAGWLAAVIEPERESIRPSAARKKTSPKTVLALPKGLIDPGERPEQTAIREVREETGLTAMMVGKLADIKYIYERSWGDRQRVFKIVTFYLLRYESGEINEISPDMRIEVKRALWLPLEEARRKLAYRGERQVAQQAESYLRTHSEAWL